MIPLLLLLLLLKFLLLRIKRWPKYVVYTEWVVLGSCGCICRRWASWEFHIIANTDLQLILPSTPEIVDDVQASKSELSLKVDAISHKLNFKRVLLDVEWEIIFKSQLVYMCARLWVGKLRPKLQDKYLNGYILSLLMQTSVAAGVFFSHIELSNPRERII